MIQLPHIIQGHFTATGDIIWLPRCHWIDCYSTTELNLTDKGKGTGDPYTNMV